MALQPGDPETRVSSGRPSSGTADVARVRLEAGRAQILGRHRSGAGGQEVVRSISALTDEVVQQMFAGICGELPGAAPPRVALIATGGYGRRELSPRSDVDLLALLPPEDAPAPERARADAVQARAASQALVREGTDVRYLESTFVPADEICFALFQAHSAEQVKELIDRAAIPYDHIVEAVRLEADQR